GRGKSGRCGNREKSSASHTDPPLLRFAHGAVSRDFHFHSRPPISIRPIDSGRFFPLRFFLAVGRVGYSWIKRERLSSAVDRQLQARLSIPTRLFALKSSAHACIPSGARRLVNHNSA